MTPRSQRWFAIAISVIVVAPLIYAAFHMLGQPWFPVGDQALIEEHVRDIGSSTPLLGPYSRYGWNHPGPIVYYLFWGPYRVMGSASTALLAASALLNAASVLGISIVAWRRGRLPLVIICSIATLIFMKSFGLISLVDPWNPLITLLPLALLLMLAWSVAEADWPTLPYTLLIGTFLVQTHVAYAALVTAVGFWCVGVSLTRRRRDNLDAKRERFQMRPTGLVVLALSVASWIPVLADQIAGTGNVAEIFRYFASADSPPAGFGKSLGIAATEMGGFAPWLGGIQAVEPSGEVATTSPVALWAPLLGFVAAACAAWRAARRGHQPAQAALRFQGLVGVVVVIGWVAVARITETVFDYLIAWWWIIAMFVWIAAAWSAWTAWSSRAVDANGSSSPTHSLSAWPMGLLLAVVTTFLAAGTSLTVGDMIPPENDFQPALVGITNETIANVPPQGSLFIRGAGSTVNSVADGLQLQLERAGHETSVNPLLSHKFGRSRTTEADEPVATVWVVSNNAIGAWAIKPGLRAIATWDPLSASERSAFKIDAETLHAQLLAVNRPDLAEAMNIGGSLYGVREINEVDQGLVDRVERQRSRGQPVTVFLGPPLGVGDRNQ